MLARERPSLPINGQHEPPLRQASTYPVPRVASPDDAAGVVAGLSAYDRAKLAVGGDPLTVVIAGLGHGPAFTWSDANGPVALFGVREIDADTAALWLLQTAAAAPYRRYLAREAPRWIEAFADDWPRLIALVDVKDRLLRALLPKAGFRQTGQTSIKDYTLTVFTRSSSDV